MPTAGAADLDGGEAPRRPITIAATAATIAIAMNHQTRLPIRLSDHEIQRGTGAGLRVERRDFIDEGLNVRRSRRLDVEAGNGAATVPDLRRRELGLCALQRALRRRQRRALRSIIPNRSAGLQGDAAFQF